MKIKIINTNGTFEEREVAGCEEAAKIADGRGWARRVEPGEKLDENADLMHPENAPWGEETTQ